jgi:hypothetical protein
MARPDVKCVAALPAKRRRPGTRTDSNTGRPRGQRGTVVPVSSLGPGQCRGLLTATVGCRTGGIAQNHALPSGGALSGQTSPRPPAWHHQHLLGGHRVSQRMSHSPCACKAHHHQPRTHTVDRACSCAGQFNENDQAQPDAYLLAEVRLCLDGLGGLRVAYVANLQGVRVSGGVDLAVDAAVAGCGGRLRRDPSVRKRAQTAACERGSAAGARDLVAPLCRALPGRPRPRPSASAVAGLRGLPALVQRSLRACQGLRPRRVTRALAMARPCVSPSADRTASAPGSNVLRGSMAGLHVPLSRLRRAPRDAQRTTRGQQGSLHLCCE